jgi:mono/diheme cytochrome c family protein
MATSPRSSATRRGQTTALLAAAIVAALVALTATACVGEPPEVTVDDPELQLGRDLYRGNCASCHGTAGGGGSGPRLADGAVVAAYPAIADQIELVANGRNRMPGYGERFDAKQLTAVVRYTREVL